MTTLTKTLVVTCLLLAVGAAFQFHLLYRQYAQSRELRQNAAALDIKIGQMRDQRDRTRALLSCTQKMMEPAQLQSGKPTTENSELGKWLGRVSQLEQALKQAPGRGIPEMKYLNSNDWLSVTMDNPLDTDAKIRTALSKLRALAKAKPEVATNLSNAVLAYIKSNDGLLPSNSDQLKPYLNPPLSDELLQRYEPAPEIAGENDANGLIRDGMQFLGSGRVVLQEKAPVDEDYDTWIGILEKGGSAMLGVSSLGKIVNQAEKNFTLANNGQNASTLDQLLPYLPISIESTKLKEYWEFKRR
jgi:hypothetical protein